MFWLYSTQYAEWGAFTFFMMAHQTFGVQYEVLIRYGIFREVIFLSAARIVTELLYDCYLF